MTDEQTVERVARRICRQYYRGSDKWDELDGIDLHHFRALARAAIAAMQPALAEVMHENAPRAIVAEIGNQIHNLGCEYQGDEVLSESLADLASRTWKAAQRLPAALIDTETDPQPDLSGTSEPQAETAVTVQGLRVHSVGIGGDDLPCVPCVVLTGPVGAVRSAATLWGEEVELRALIAQEGET